MKLGEWEFYTSKIIAVSEVKSVTSFPEDGFYFEVMLKGGIIQSPTFDGKEEAQKIRDELWGASGPMV